MESAVCVRGFLLIISTTGVHLSPQTRQAFGHEGDDVRFNPGFSRVDDSLLYRVGGDGDLLLLINCSQPERPQPHGHKVECVNSSDSYFKMSNLTLSQSGDYMVEGWRGHITEHTNYRLTVCAEKGKSFSESLNFGASAELCGKDSPLGHGSSLQLYRYDKRLENYILVLDTKSSLEPLVEDLRGRLQVDLNTSLVTLTGFIRRDSTGFYCTAWRGAQCHSYSYRRLSIAGSLSVFAHEGENVTLPCIAKGEELPDQVYWDTDTGRGQLIINQTHPQEVMYMLNGSQTGDYSLIIPSVSKQHTGVYECRGSGPLIDIRGNDLLNSTVLFVCTKLSPLEVMFSPGQSVLFNITEHMKNFELYWTEWYRQKFLQPQTLIVVYSKSPVSRPEDLRGRVTVSTSRYNSTLIISNLTAENSGLYTWRLYGWDESRRLLCSVGSFRLVYLQPYGVHSPFYRAYAPLIGCGLLGLVAAVVWLKPRSRRGEQTSGRQSREGQQSGDEDLYDEVEMAELNTPPSAVSAGAVEHSV